LAGTAPDHLKRTFPIKRNVFRFSTKEAIDALHINICTHLQSKSNMEINPVVPLISATGFTKSLPGEGRQGINIIPQINPRVAFRKYPKKVGNLLFMGAYI